MVVIVLLAWPIGVSKNKKRERTQVTENALPAQTPFRSSPINQILRVGSYPGYLSWFQVSLRSVEKCGNCAGQNFGLPVDLAHHMYNSLLLPHKQWQSLSSLPLGERISLEWGYPSMMSFFTRESSYCFQRVLAISILSIRLSVTRVDQSKAVQARITKSSPSAAWKTLVSGTVKLVHKFEGGHPERGC